MSIFSLYAINYTWVLFFLFIAISVARFKLKQIYNNELHFPHILDFLPFAIFFAILWFFEIGGLNFSAITLADETSALSAGFLLISGGFLLYIYTHRLLADCWSANPSATPPRLVTEGIYSKVRHPMYTAITIMMLGSAIVGMNWILILGVFAAFAAFYFKALDEEKVLQLIFNDYAVYKQTTKMFLPRIF